MTDQTIQITRTITRDEFAYEMTRRLIQAMTDELSSQAKGVNGDELNAVHAIRSLLQSHPDGSVVDGALHELVTKAMRRSEEQPFFGEVDEGVPL